MWTRKASFTFTGGIALVLIGMMISNLQMFYKLVLPLAVARMMLVNSQFFLHLNHKRYIFLFHPTHQGHLVWLVLFH